MTWSLATTGGDGTRRTATSIRILGVMALLLGLVPTVARAQVPGATYSGKVSGGGTVTFTVTADGNRVHKFTARNVKGNTCIFTKVVFNSDIPISGNSFSNSDVSGSFSGTNASGKLRFVQEGIPGIIPACDTGTHSWSAQQIQPQTLKVATKGSGNGKVTSKPSGIKCGSDCKEDYDKGTKVTLKAKPGKNSVFEGWSGDCKGKGSCKVTMNGDRSVKATFTAMYELTVDKLGTGEGTVTSNPSGISCGNDCKQSYEKGTDVTLTATPSEGSEFVEWSGACSGTGSCNVEMDKNRDVRARFDLVPGPEPTGSPTPSPSPSPSGSPGGGTYEGTWSGVTEQDLPVSFTVNSQDLITHYEFGWDTGTCSGVVERTFPSGGVEIDEWGMFMDDNWSDPGAEVEWYFDGFLLSPTESWGSAGVTGSGACGYVDIFWDAWKE